MSVRKPKVKSQEWYESIPTLDEAKFTGFILARVKGPECIFISCDSDSYVHMINNLYVATFKQAYDKYQRHLAKLKHINEIRGGIISEQFLHSGLMDEILFRTIPNKIEGDGDRFRKAVCGDACKVNRALVKEISAKVVSNGILINVIPHNTRYRIKDFKLTYTDIENAVYGYDEKELAGFKRLEKSRVLFCRIVKEAIINNRSKIAISRLARLFMVSQGAREIGALLPYYDMKDVLPQYKERLKAYREREEARAAEIRKAASEFIISRGIESINNISNNKDIRLYHEVLFVLAQFINADSLEELKNSDCGLYKEVSRYTRSAGFKGLGMGMHMPMAFFKGFGF